MSDSPKPLTTSFALATNDHLTKEDLARAMNPPHDGTLETLHGIKVQDPFRPMEKNGAPKVKNSKGEEVDGPWEPTEETNAWIARENQKFEDYIKGLEGHASMAAATSFLTKALDYDRGTLPSRYGDTYFRNFIEGLKAQPLMQISSSKDGPWETILDPNTFTADGTRAISGCTISPDGKRIAYLTSDKGSDEQTLYVYDVASRKTLSDKITNARFTTVVWDKDSNEGFQYTYPLHDNTLRSMIKHHTVGATQAQDPTVFEALPNPDDMISPFRLQKTNKYEWIDIQAGTDKNSGLMFRAFGSAEPFKTLLEPKKTSLSPIAELEDGTVLAITTRDASRGKLIQFDPNNPDEKNWKTIIPEAAPDQLESAFIHKGKLYTVYSADTATAVRVYTPEGQHLYDMDLPIQSVASFGKINKDDDTFSLMISSFKTPGDTYSYDIDKNELTLIKKSEAPFRLDDAIVERHHAISKDGTLVPYTTVRMPETELDGSAATKLYGYGGFNVPLEPSCSSSMAQFVKAGGIFVQANLRGGGEFGEDWYNGGRVLVKGGKHINNKQNVFDDFAAVAKDLAAKKYTSPGRLVINGGSNGGLLAAAVALQYADEHLFEASIPEVGVHDLTRFHTGTFGAAWKSDYGNPDDARDFAIELTISPQHLVKRGMKLPKILIKTADHDDRVLPWHSLKLAALLQAITDKSNTILLRVEHGAGHGAGKPTDKVIQAVAESFAFIEKALGPVDQKAWKLEQAAKAKAQIAKAPDRKMS